MPAPRLSSCAGLKMARRDSIFRCRSAISRAFSTHVTRRRRWRFQSSTSGSCAGASAWLGSGRLPTSGGLGGRGPQKRRRGRWRAGRGGRWPQRLARLGPAPYLGVTWRAGARKENRPEFAAQGEDPLQKEIDLALLASAVRAWRGSVLVLQRLPLEGEVAAFGRALGRPCADLSAVNEDLADAAALLCVLDEDVGVSNTNMHIRAGVGKPARVAIPFPAEFRWMNAGSRSPWFPGFSLYRESPARDWRRALTALAHDLTA